MKGRPTLYSEEILDNTEKYILSCKDTLTKVNIPTIEGLAIFLKINKDSIYTWRKLYSDFSELIEELLAHQAKALINNGLSGRYNPTIAKVLLTKHGYREGTDSDVTSGGEKIQGVVILPSKNESPLEATTKAGDSPQS